MRFLLAATLLLAALPATASAATVTVTGDEVRYAAAPGEANRVLVAYAGDARSVTITDPGAVITPYGPCVALDARTARCTRRPEAEVEWLQSTRVELGDGDDEVQTTRPGPAPIGGVIAFGGPGDDRLDGGAGSDMLDGGGGTDVLLGGDGFDTLADGDTDAGANADTLDGGAQRDTVSYAQRTGPVRVQLGDALADGAPGEGDVIRAVEGATGGAGDDRLVGDRGLNELTGGPGDDALIGLGGEDDDGFGDRLRGGAGDDTLRGGDGPDDLRGERGTDLVTCGRGPDIVDEPKRGEWLERGCDAIRYSFGVAGEDSLLFRPHPRATTRTSARFAVGCPNRELLDGEESRCRGTLTLREASSGRRLIGRGVLAGRLGHAAPPVRVTLTPLGRRLARRGVGVDVTATIAGRGIPTRSWTFALRTR
jgi:hypothetical protein